MLDVTGSVLLDNMLIRLCSGLTGLRSAIASTLCRRPACRSKFELRWGLAGWVLYAVSGSNGMLGLTARSAGVPVPEPESIVLTAPGAVVLMSCQRP